MVSRLRAETTAATTEGAVAALHRAHYRSLVRLAVLLLDDMGAGEEVVQDAFVRLQVGWGRLADAERAPAYLRSSVLNGARSRLRHRQVRARHRQPAAAPGASAEVAALAADDHDRMVAALRRLAPRQREALVLRYYLDLSEREMAAAMGISAGSVRALTGSTNRCRRPPPPGPLRVAVGWGFTRCPGHRRVTWPRSGRRQDARAPREPPDQKDLR